MKSFVSWSGGKDACLSYYKAVKDNNVEAKVLLNMVSEDGKASRTHGISAELLRLQAEAIGVAIIQKKTGWNQYETKFKKAASGFKNQGILTGVFGDIDLDEHREWVERVSGESGISPIFPLWQKKREDILVDFIKAGFEAIVVSVNRSDLGPEWLGRKIDKSFISDLKKLNTVDLCGEAGEYHTFVYDGPIFRKRINILKTEKQKRGKNRFLDILDYEISCKN
ncbi:MAG: diphthine--ammonia ligase [Candidatus Omnitrophica bacterium]|nr:diphthine--ammonia ligase [Candidatus Omnitrophota bacterium]